ncbi:MAG: hypothetical protein HYX59_00425 [Elusimicrobia bacterium]|nr:hypothetical protein [Elusimicrobiota bacterium]
MRVVAESVKAENSRSDYSPSRVLAAVAKLEDRDVSPRSLQDSRESDIRGIFDALRSAALHDPESPRLHREFVDVFSEMERRGIVTEYDALAAYRAHMGARDFKAAAALRIRFPSVIPPGPVIPSTPTGSPRSAGGIYDLADGWKRVELKSLPPTESPRIVMTMFPGCSVSEAAMEELLADPELGPVFRKFGVLLSHRFDAEGIHLWRSHFGFPSIYIVESSRSFPQFSFDSAPRFYFMRGDRVVDQFEGWRTGSNELAGINRWRKAYRAMQP